MTTWLFDKFVVISKKQVIIVLRKKCQMCNILHEK